MVGAGAIILGPVVIGDNARVGAGSVAVKDVPPDATVVGVPARLAGRRGDDVSSVLNHGELPDPMVRALTEVFERQSAMVERIADLEQTVARLHEIGRDGACPIGDRCARSSVGCVAQCLGSRDRLDIVELGFIRAIDVSGRVCMCRWC